MQVSQYVRQYGANKVLIEWLRTFSAASVIFLVRLASRSFTSLASVFALLLRGRAPRHFPLLSQGGIPLDGHKSPPSHWRGVQGSERMLPHTWNTTHKHCRYVAIWGPPVGRGSCFWKMLQSCLLLSRNHTLTYFLIWRQQCKVPVWQREWDQAGRPCCSSICPDLWCWLAELGFECS